MSEVTHQAPFVSLRLLKGLLQKNFKSHLTEIYGLSDSDTISIVFSASNMTLCELEGILAQRLVNRHISFKSLTNDVSVGYQ